MADWVTTSSLATAGGTLALAAATFAAGRSADQNARATERALLAAIRPVLVPSRLERPPQKLVFPRRPLDQGRRPGARVADITEDAIHLILRTPKCRERFRGAYRRDFVADLAPGNESHGDPQTFAASTRDLDVPGGDLGFWQGAFRDPDAPIFNGGGRDHHASTDGDLSLVRRPRGRPAHDHPVRGDSP